MDLRNRRTATGRMMWCRPFLPNSGVPRVPGTLADSGLSISGLAPAWRACRDGRKTIPNPGPENCHGACCGREFRPGLQRQARVRPNPPPLLQELSARHPGCRRRHPTGLQQTNRSWHRECPTPENDRLRRVRGYCCRMSCFHRYSGGSIGCRRCASSKSTSRSRHQLSKRRFHRH